MTLTLTNSATPSLRALRHKHFARNLNVQKGTKGTKSKVHEAATTASESSESFRKHSDQGFTIDLTITSTIAQHFREQSENLESLHLEGDYFNETWSRPTGNQRICDFRKHGSMRLCEQCSLSEFNRKVLHKTLGMNYIMIHLKHTCRHASS